MLFNSRKRIANQIGLMLNNTLRPPFIWTEYLSDGQFKPPAAIFTDPYVVGFLYGLVGLAIKFDFNGDNMSVEKKGFIIMDALQYAFPDNYKHVLQLADDYATGMIKDKSEFQRALTDGQTMYGAAAGRLKADDPDPVAIAARSLAKSMGGTFMNEGGKIANDSNASLAAAVGILTINKHIKEKYLKKTDAA